MKKAVRIPQLVSLIAAVIALACFFLPYISTSKEYREELDLLGDNKVFESSDLTYKDMKDMSLFEYTKSYIQAGEEMFRDKESGILYGVIFAAAGALAFLVLLCALGRKPVLMMIFTLLMTGVVFLINWDFEDRGIMPSAGRHWGTAYYLYFAAAAILIIASVWMFIAKRKDKKNSMVYDMSGRSMDD